MRLPVNDNSASCTVDEADVSVHIFLQTVEHHTLLHHVKFGQLLQVIAPLAKIILDFFCIVFFYSPLIWIKTCCIPSVCMETSFLQNISISISRNRMLMLTNTTFTLMQFEPRFSAVLKCSFWRRKAAVVLRKVAEGSRFHCGQYDSFAVFAVHLRLLVVFCSYRTAENRDVNRINGKVIQLTIAYN